MSLISKNFTDAVCEGCLSVDRKLTSLLEEDSNYLFIQILYPVSSVNPQPLLCWECLALLHKFTKFKNQVKKAHENLIKYMLNEISQIHSLSNLANNKVKCFKYEVTLFDNQDILNAPGKDESRYVFDELRGPRNLASGYVENKYSNICEESQNAFASGIEVNMKLLNNLTRNDSKNEGMEMLPLDIVKIEENESDLDVCDELNNSFDDIKKDDGANNFETVECDAQAGDDFDESDDEPLHVKKSKAVEDLLLSSETRKTNKNNNGRTLSIRQTHFSSLEVLQLPIIINKQRRSSFSFAHEDSTMRTPREPVSVRFGKLPGKKKQPPCFSRHVLGDINWR